jgi:hypothetical protein
MHLKSRALSFACACVSDRCPEVKYRDLSLELPESRIGHYTIATMRFLSSVIPSLLLLGAGVAQAASWGFDEAVLSVNSKGAGVAGGLKDKYV